LSQYEASDEARRDLLNADENYAANSSYGIDGHTKLVVTETSSEAKNKRL
jgi:hypothetical protein